MDLRAILTAAETWPAEDRIQLIEALREGLKETATATATATTARTVTRRDAIGAAALTGAALAGLTTSAVSADDKPMPSSNAEAIANEKLDRERVIACGFTEAEADCWALLGRTAGKFFELPKLHVMDDHEIAHAIHVLQYRLMSRPAYRRYRSPAPAPAPAPGGAVDKK